VKLQQILRRPWAWAVIAIVVILTVATIFRHGEEYHPEMVDAPRSELALRNGKLFQEGQGSPFTGHMVENYPSGQLKSKSSVIDGVLNGPSEGWHTNGQMQVREIFKNGISDGVRKTWFENGKQATETTIVNGKLNGPFRKWHENGQLAEQMDMKDGQADGIALSYFPSGFLKARVRLEAGKVLEQKFWKDGEQKEAPVAEKK
jgi:antitoxin component YwqK of YwqJK toxin-antitoxin module